MAGAGRKRNSRFRVCNSDKRTLIDGHCLGQVPTRIRPRPACKVAVEDRHGPHSQTNSKPTSLGLVRSVARGRWWPPSLRIPRGSGAACRRDRRGALRHKLDPHPARGRVEPIDVGDAIEYAAAANEVVQDLTLGILLRAPVRRIAASQRSGDNGLDDCPRNRSGSRPLAIRDDHRHHERTVRRPSQRSSEFV